MGRLRRTSGEDERAGRNVGIIQSDKAAPRALKTYSAKEQRYSPLARSPALRRSSSEGGKASSGEHGTSGEKKRVNTCGALMLDL